jgi:tRNA(Ile)-lysidine synthase
MQCAISRSSLHKKLPERDTNAVVRALERALAAHAADDDRLAVALSGGRDSVALLAAACDVARDRVVAIHVHHGLSSQADAWATHCAALARNARVPLVLRRLELDRNDPRGIEEAARVARYEALADAARESGAAVVLLAHHQDDQAETLLLQLGRGAGPHGLAGMPAARRDAGGMLWLRPFLDLPRAAIEAFVRARNLQYVDDDSNASVRHRRNALRQGVIPVMKAALPGYPSTLARAAALQADAARLADDLADIDASALVHGGTLDRDGFRCLLPHRARNLLRHFLRAHGLRAPSSARLAEMVDQLVTARGDARVELKHDGRVLGIHRGRIVVHRASPPRFFHEWHGERSVALPHGRLLFSPSLGEGLAQALIAGRGVVIRAREGGESVRLFRDRPRRALKAWLQEAGMPHWERDALPLVFCDDALAAVPGLGVATEFAAGPGSASVRVEWEPNET